MSAPTTNIKIVFGCMTLGDEGKEQSRVYDEATVKQILQTFASHGHDELDSARMYGQGSSERMLARVGAEAAGFKIATKTYPSARSAGMSFGKYTHDQVDIPRALNDSLEALQTKKVDLYYLHAPDRQVPFAETLEAIDKEYKAGKFTRFGVSNYTAAEVEEIVALCKENGWVQPSVYQVVYNALVRSAEPDLFPVLRKHNIAIYTFNPLAGGLFSGAITSQDVAVEKGSRFDPDRVQGAMYRKRYFKDAYFDAIKSIKDAADKEGLTLPEVALRWVMHHSALEKKKGDAVLIGASSTKHIDQNLKDFEKAPLPQSVVDAVDQAWESVKSDAPSYHH